MAHPDCTEFFPTFESLRETVSLFTLLSIGVK